MDISKLNKAKLLAALYNGADPKGMGLFQFAPENMTQKQAQKIIDDCGYKFDYIKGRVMKIDLSGDELRTALYNRDNGLNAAEDIINNLG